MAAFLFCIRDKCKKTYKEDMVDWMGAEDDYKSNKISLREMGNKYGCSEAAVRKKAKKEGWVRGEKSRPSNEKVFLDQTLLDGSKSGFIYVIYFEDSNCKRFYKIGMTGSFNNRLMTHQGSSPFNICVACAYYVGNMRDEESFLHLAFKDKRVRGEWFCLDEFDLLFIASRSLLV